MPSGYSELTQQAHALVAAGDLAGARDLLDVALRDADPNPDTAGPDLTEAAGLAARVLVTLGDAHAAHGWAALAHAAATRLYGSTDQRTVAAAATLAAVLHRVGNHARAADLYRGVIIELTATDGPESLRVLAAHADLAVVEYAQGECTVARDRLQDAWELHREVYGDAHPSGIRMLARLGAMQRDCGRVVEAHQNLALAQELCREHLPADHPLAAQVAALARAEADPDHVCADAPASTRNPPRIPAARADSPGDLPTPDPRFGDPGGTVPPYLAPTDTVGTYDTTPEPRPASGGSGYGESGEDDVASGAPAPGEAGPWADPATPVTHHPPASPAPASWSPPASVPPPRLPSAPPVGGSPPPWTASTGDRPSRPPVPPPRAAVDGAGFSAGYPPERAGGGSGEPDTESDRRSPGAVTRDRADEPGSGQPEPAVPPLPPAVPGFVAGDRADPAWAASESPRTPGVETFAGDTEAGQARYLPAPRSPRLPAPVPRPTRPRRRIPPAAIAGFVLVALAGTAAVTVGFGLAGRREDPRPPASAVATSPATRPPASPGTPPGNLTLVDERTRVTLTWVYPSGAQGRVVLAAGRAGQELRDFQELPAGSTGYVVYGLDAQTNYCFSVAVVYSPEVVGRTDPVCTERPSTEPAR